MDVKAAVPKSAGGNQKLTKKMFVGGTGEITDEDFKAYWEQYGEVEDAVVGGTAALALLASRDDRRAHCSGQQVIEVLSGGQQWPCLHQPVRRGLRSSLWSSQRSQRSGCPSWHHAVNTTAPALPGLHMPHQRLLPHRHLLPGRHQPPACCPTAHLSHPPSQPANMPLGQPPDRHLLHTPATLPPSHPIALPPPDREEGRREPPLWLCDLQRRGERGEVPGGAARHRRAHGGAQAGCAQGGGGAARPGGAHGRRWVGGWLWCGL